MDAVLLVITIGALGLAVLLAVVGWKLLRHDRDQTAARVEALRALAAEPERAIAETPRPAPETPVVVPLFARRAPLSIQDDETSDWDATLGQTLSPPTEHGAPLFSSAATTPAPSHRLALVAVVAVVMLASAGTVYALYRPSAAANQPNAERLVPASTVPLELLSLSESTDPDGTFRVTGLVGNPSGGRPAQGVVAVVYLFDGDGRYFATGRAGIDLASLAPGDQSPFVVNVPHGSAAIRYRVGFREPDGAVVAHVDKRGQMIEGTTEGGAVPRGTGH
jgi:hypothetical protein